MKKNYMLTILGMLCSSLILLAQSGTQTFTSSGLFFVPPGVTTVTVELVGAGGDGGGNGGGGGGGGGYASGTYSVTPGDSMLVNVGIGGGGPNVGSTGIAALSIFAFGGDNGTSVSNPNLGGGGVGGNASGGNIANNSGGTGGGGYWTYFGGGGGGAAGSMGNGQNGGNTIVWSGMCVTPGGAYGASGGAPGGDGGKGAGFTDVNCNNTDPAGNGLSYGGGGGGGNGNGGVEGNGSGGYCVIAWGPSALQAINAALQVSIAPNPFSDRIQVLHARGNETYEVVNAQGQLVWAGKDISEQDFSALAAGFYLVRVHGNNGAQVLKLAKQ
jgi:hypothetical protein